MFGTPRVVSGRRRPHASYAPGLYRNAKLQLCYNMQRHGSSLWSAAVHRGLVAVEKITSICRPTCKLSFGRYVSGVFCTNNAQAPSLFSNVTLTSRRSYVETVSGNSALLQSNCLDHLTEEGHCCPKLFQHTIVCLLVLRWKRGRELVHCLYKKLQTCLPTSRRPAKPYWGRYIHPIVYIDHKKLDSSYRACKIAAAISRHSVGNFIAWSTYCFIACPSRFLDKFTCIFHRYWKIERKWFSKIIHNLEIWREFCCDRGGRATNTSCINWYQSLEYVVVVEQRSQF